MKSNIGRKEIEITNENLENDWVLLMEMSKACCFQGLYQHNQQAVFNVTSYAITRGDMVDFNESSKLCFVIDSFQGDDVGFQQKMVDKMFVNK